jgi:hypothetical protein
MPGNTSTKKTIVSTVKGCKMWSKSELLMTLIPAIPKIGFMRRRAIAVIHFLVPMLLATLLSSLPISKASAEAFEVTTLSGRGGSGVFAHPSGVAISPDGSIYVVDQDNFKIKRIVGNTITDFATSTAITSKSSDDSYCSIYLKNVDEIFVSDCRNLRVFKFNKAGTLLRTYNVNLNLPAKCGNCRDWGGGIAVDTLGGIFLSDEHNHVIIRVDENSGAAKVYAGIAGKNGSTDGEISTSTLNLPRGLAIDLQDNLLVVDRWSDAIRRITPGGKVSTVEKNMGCLTGVSVDSNGSIIAINERYCAPTIFKVGSRKILDDSKSLTPGIPGYSGRPAFSGGSGLSVDRYGPNPSNNIYISDWANHSIKVFSNSGALIRTIGQEDGYGGTQSQSSYPLYDFPVQTFSLDDGSYLVADLFSIKHLSASGEIVRTTPLTQSCWYSGGVAFTPDGTFFCTNGSFIMARFLDGTWRKIGTGDAGRKDGSSAVAQFDRAEGLAVFRGDLYVGDANNRQIRKVSRISNSKDFEVTTVLGTGVWTSAPDVQPRAKATFAFPGKIVIDSSGNLYIADGGVDSIFKTSLVQETDVTRIARGLGDWPSSMVVDKENTVYVSTYLGKFFRIKNNQMTGIGGRGYGNQDGTLDNAAFNRPNGLSIDSKGSLIVADRDNQRIKKISVGTSPGAVIHSASTLSQYLKIPEAITPTFSGMTATEESSLEKSLTANNQNGLIARYYQGTSAKIPARSTSGLPLCNVTIEKSIFFDWGYSPLSNSNGCGQENFVVTFKGFIKWPGIGQQTRSIHASVDDGMYLKVNNATVIDKWSDGGANPNWPYNASANLTLEGGKQYPIEVWYYAWAPPSNFKLYWSPFPSTRELTIPIESQSLSPGLDQAITPSLVVTKPTMPKLPSISVNLNFVNLVVEVPIGISSSILYAPEFGVTKQKPIFGQIIGNKANFEMAINSKYAGKKGTLQIVNKNSAGESDALKIPVTAPKVKSKPVAVKTVAPKQPTQARQPVITCLKGATKRIFEGTDCPPGYTKG